MAEGERGAGSGAVFADVPAFVRALSFEHLPTKSSRARSRACST